MEAKQKAKELVIKKFGCSKGYALKAVDEIIANIEPSVSEDVISSRIKYWKEVKEEIKKL